MRTVLQKLILLPIQQSVNYVTMLTERSIKSKVAHYVHVAGFPMKLPVRKNAELPTMNIYSGDDMILRKGKDIPGAVNVQFLQTASSEKTFKAIFLF